MKLTEWNSECEKTVLLEETESGIWRNTADKQHIWEHDPIVKARQPYCMFIYHMWRLRVDGVVYFSMQLNPNEEEFIILKKDQKVFVDKSTSEMCDKDACMWSNLGTPTVVARPARLRDIGCRTPILQFVCGAFVHCSHHKQDDGSLSPQTS